MQQEKEVQFEGGRGTIWESLRRNLQISYDSLCVW